MGAASGYYFLFISTIGAIFMFGLGYVLGIDYIYVPINNRVENASVCYWTGIIYSVVAFLCVVYIKKCSIPQENLENPSEPQGQWRSKIDPQPR